MRTFKEFLAEMDMGTGNPGIEKAFSWIMQTYHGAGGTERVQELMQPGFANLIMRKFGLSPHEVREPIEAAYSDLTGQEMP
jgi:hypothetical protein